MIAARYLAGLALVWFALGASPALGARVAPLSPHLNPSGGPELRDRFQDAIARGLQQGTAAGSVAGVDVMSGSDVRVRLQADSDLLGCIGGPCLQKAAGTLSVDRVVVGEIEVSGKNYNITLRLLDQGGVEMFRTTESCEICTVREADDAVGRAAARVSGYVPQKGPTEQARDKEKEAAAQRQSEQSPPQALTPLSPQQRPEMRHLYYRYGWISALVLSGVFVAASIPFLYYGGRDGQTNCDPSVARRDCPTVYQGNLGTGLGLLLGGALAVGGGAFAALFYLDYRDQKRASARVSLMPTLGGAMVGIEGRF